MGQCQYKVANLQENGIMALNATTLEPWPIFNPSSGSSGAYGGFRDDEHLVFANDSIRFQCINPYDTIWDLDTNEPIRNDDDGIVSNFVIHTCTSTNEFEDDPDLGNYACHNAPSSLPTVSPVPSQIPSSMPTEAPTLSSAPSISPTSSSAPSSSPSASPSMAPSQQSMANRISIHELRDTVQGLSDLQTTENTQIMEAIAALNQRLDTIEAMVIDANSKTNHNTQQISQLRGYTQRKIEDTQYWVSRAWWYNTQTSINWNDDNKYT